MSHGNPMATHYTGGVPQLYQPWCLRCSKVISKYKDSHTLPDGIEVSEKCNRGASGSGCSECTRKKGHCDMVLEKYVSAVNSLYSLRDRLDAAVRQGKGEFFEEEAGSRGWGVRCFCADEVEDRQEMGRRRGELVMMRRAHEAAVGVE
ncbi:hypothetical protein DSL72_000054 [Monilinia vaccinii-corymbosi]|uniref:Uncharacterized protein n=1 Tax=Monilinia vaccinii-corymbosi TaxID=61207 RepID=A0A8A3P1Z6_9HELO|nr:hypothetical protein DSL72_000054 [Monilinia vaccinii-corymbosi]